MSSPADRDLGEDAAGRLLEAIAILDAIERAELLVALPKGADAARRHQCAVSLLAVLRRELTALACDLQSATLVRDVMIRIRSPGTTE